MVLTTFVRLKPPLCKCGCKHFVTYSKQYKRWNIFCRGHGERKNKIHKTYPAPLCACGCGQSVVWSSLYRRWNMYINNHRQLKGGWKHEEETKNKIRITNKKVHNTEIVKEKHRQAWTEERRQATSIRVHELWQDEEFSSKMTVIRKEIWTREEYIKQQKNKQFSEEWRKQISEQSKAMWSDEYKQEFGKNHQGENNFNWKGGLSFLPYSSKFTKALKREIKTRDNHTCQNPNCPKTNPKLSVHHIDYDKQNCDPENLITLCMSCNQRANGNRDYWTELYQKMLYDKKNNITELPIT